MWPNSTELFILLCCMHLYNVSGMASPYDGMQQHQMKANKVESSQFP